MYAYPGRKKKSVKECCCSRLCRLSIFFAFERYPSPDCEQCSPCCFGGVSEVLPWLSCAGSGFPAWYLIPVVVLLPTSKGTGF